VKKNPVVQEAPEVQFWNPSKLVFPQGYADLLRSQLRAEVAAKGVSPEDTITFNPLFCNDEVKQQERTENEKEKESEETDWTCLTSLLTTDQRNAIEKSQSMQ